MDMTGQFNRKGEEIVVLSGGLCRCNGRGV